MPGALEEKGQHGGWGGRRPWGEGSRGDQRGWELLEGRKDLGGPWRPEQGLWILSSVRWEATERFEQRNATLACVFAKGRSGYGVERILCVRVCVSECVMGNRG